MKASIVINSYNYARYVGETIESALAQTYPNVEVVVVDDGSTDNSVEIIRSYEPRIRFRSKENGGQGSAINVGCAMAAGDIIFLLDSDDTLRPDAVEKVVAAWRPGLSKIHFHLAVTDAELRPLGSTVPRGKLPEGDLSRQVLNEGIYICPPTSGNAFSREFLQQVLPMPEEDWIVGADSYPLFLAPLYGKIGAINEPLGCYRTHTGSVISMDSRVEPAKLVRLLQIDANLRRTLERFCDKLNLPLSPEASASHWLHYKLRLASCKLSGPLHPFAGDRTPTVAARLIRSVFRAPDLSPRMRTMLSVWAVAVAGLPKGFSEPLIRFALSPGQRPNLMRLLLRT